MDELMDLASKETGAMPLSNATLGDLSGQPRRRAMTAAGSHPVSFISALAISTVPTLPGMCTD